MKIRTRLTLLFTLITASILFVFAFVIYISTKESREREFYALLKKEAITKANLFLKARVDKKILQDIYFNNQKILNEVEVAIYDTNFNLLYHDAIEIDYVKESQQMIDDINKKGEITFYQNQWQVIGLKYEFKGNNYIVTATALDQYGYNKLDSLFKTMIMVFIISILLIYVAGRYFSKRAFKPVKDMTDRATHITATNLDLRLVNGSSKDELAELANTFNEMLNRLEDSFDAQKSFVSNISHEIRTPLAAIITELEISKNKERSVDEYQKVIENTLHDAQKLARLSNSLLDFAKASYDTTKIAFKPVRVDEILLDARFQIQKANPSYKININFENDFEDDNQISILGNEYLLKVAFANLFENGCKFSDNQQSQVSISFGKEIIKLQFSDTGIGIPKEDIEHIFSPFYRGKNKQFADGNGIGLPLTKKIIDLHKGQLLINSVSGSGTTFTIELPSF